ncbi:cytochrome c biogenesis heme-transporting ATPase CcmA [Thiolapillus brandeum]|uniref:Heme exporter protein CcmA n=1 Tax=Thiolapillus brandeum TaxID=1076588 RepID=A0A7U6JG96_9GAMM|nr:cytochrome c biogenesis heme-transporting ATPase CcmA [Thiolapillus brandeum]BAO43464.1 heme exporter protein CcmA [Thiolapillus brandeum]
MLEVIDLQCTRGDRHLFSGVDFTLSEGELLHLHGHNGSGKTTLLRTLCGLVSPTQGEVCWRGTPIRRQRDEYAAELLYLGHKNGLKDDLTGIENLLMACRMSGLKVAEDQAWNVLEKMGLRGHEDLPARVLSQGQQKRVALARLLLSRAPLWILDEPFVGLDIAAVALLEKVVADHVAGGGLAVLTTHQEVALTSGKVKRLRLGWKEDGHV